MSGTVPSRWDVSKSHRGVSRVEVWTRTDFGGEQLSVIAGADLIGGAVTEKYVTGIRRTLSLVVPFTKDWVKWSALPGLEVRVFSGLAWGADDEFLLPLGRFPILPPQLSLPRADITVAASDYWAWVLSRNFMWPQQVGPLGPAEYQGPITGVVYRLVESAGVGFCEIDASRLDEMPNQLWDKGYHDAISAAVASIGAEVFVKRDGQPVIRDRIPTAGLPLVDGEDGTIIGIQSTSDWSNVYNAVTVISSNTNVHFPPATASITDPDHPAFNYKIGRRENTISSPLVTSYEQAMVMAESELRKASAPALSWSVDAVPDPSREAGDQCRVLTAGLGAVNSVVQSITHDLAGGPMKLTLGAV